MASKQPGKVVHKDEAPVNFRKHCIDDPKEEGCHSSPVELGACHTLGAHLVGPPFITNLGHLESPVPRVDLDTSVCLADICLEDVPFRGRSGHVHCPCPPFGVSGPEAPARLGGQVPHKTHSQCRQWTQSMTVGAVVHSSVRLWM